MLGKINLKGKGEYVVYVAEAVKALSVTASVCTADRVLN